MTVSLPGGRARYERFAAPAAAATAHGLRMAVNLVVIKFIAVLVGPAGLGLLGNLMSAATMVAVFAGGGILNGITKYVAEYDADPECQARFLRCATAYGLTASVIVFIVCCVAASPLSRSLFGDTSWAWLFPLIGITHLLCFIGGGIVAIVNGKRQPTIFAVITITGYLGVVPATYFLIRLGGVAGASIALLAVASATAIPALLVAGRRGLLTGLRPRFDRIDTCNLFRFTCIAAVSAIAFPLTEIMIRLRLTEDLGLTATGIWQALARLSGANLGFFTVFLATSYMPRLSSISDRGEATSTVLRSLSLIGPAFACCAIVIYLARSIIVPLLFADAFRPMETIVGWQLLGDFFRVCSYVVGFLVVARAALKIHVMAELTQCVLYFTFTVIALNMNHGLQGVAQAYAATYAIYFVLTLIALREFARP